MLMSMAKMGEPICNFWPSKFFHYPSHHRPGTRLVPSGPEYSDGKNPRRENTKEAVVLDNKVVQWQLFVCKRAAADSFTGLQIYPQARSRHQNTAQIHQLENNTQIHADQNTAQIHQLENNTQIHSYQNTARIHQLENNSQIHAYHAYTQIDKQKDIKKDSMK